MGVRELTEHGNWFGVLIFIHIIVSVGRVGPNKFIAFNAELVAIDSGSLVKVLSTALTAHSDVMMCAI